MDIKAMTEEERQEIINLFNTAGPAEVGRFGDASMDSNKELEVEGLRLIAEHNNHVQQNMAAVIANLAKRMANHDQSKYSDAEMDLVLGKPALNRLEYNTPEYKEGLAKVQTAVASHYASNDHHPEHFTRWECNGCFKVFDNPPDNLHCDVCLCEIFEQPDGIAGMNLLALLEMACDWKAASDEHGSSYLESVHRNVERFGLSNEMQRILTATGIEMGWLQTPTPAEEA